MSTVGKSPDTTWRALLVTKGLSAAAPILEDYGLSCENDMSLLDEDDLMTLCSKLSSFQANSCVNGFRDLNREMLQT